MANREADFNHASWNKLIEKTNTSVLTQIGVDRYFKLTEDKRRGVSYLTLKLVRNSITKNISIGENELLAFITILWKKNEEMENYELAAIFKNIMENYKVIYNSVKPVKKVRKINVT
jgi:hypothetical protein